MKGLYKVVKNLIDSEEAAILADKIQKCEYLRPCDQVKDSLSIYTFPPCNILLGSLCEKISKNTGKNLKPAYSFARVYRKGNVLTPHKDRPSCEYSVTINLKQTHPWAIYMGKKPIIQSVGDGVIYKGCEIEHSRKPFEGDEYVQIFLHYVDSDGPHVNFAFDMHNIQEKTVTCLFARPNSHLTEFIATPNALTNEECDKLTKNEFEMTDAFTGDCQLTPKVRKSKIFWIPMIESWRTLYEKILVTVGECNDRIFKFDLTRMAENLQYTEYEESYQGHYSWHYDVGGNQIDSGRKLSIVVQLSDPSEYEGGELHIICGDDKEYNIAPKEKGTMIIFPSYLRHRVTPVTKGKRCSLVTWINGPPFR